MQVKMRIPVINKSQLDLMVLIGLKRYFDVPLTITVLPSRPSFSKTVLMIFFYTTNEGYLLTAVEPVAFLDSDPTSIALGV